MEDWARDLMETLEAAATDIELFLADVAKGVADMVDTLVEATEEVAEQVQSALVSELDPPVSEFIDSILEAYLGIEIAVENASQPVMHTVEPILNNHPACVGCRNYHGQMYGGNVLVCGMHPYGWEGEQCPDWESTWKE
jgi:hypothetical protein